MPDPLLQEPVFIGIRSGKRHSAGYICFVGKDVTVSAIVERLGDPVSEAAAVMLADYLQQLRQFTIDNVVAVSWAGGRLQLVKVADHTRRERKRRLP